MSLNRGLTGSELQKIIGVERFNKIAGDYGLEGVSRDPNTANQAQILALLVGFATRAKSDDLTPDKLEKLSRLFPPSFSFSAFSNELSYHVKGLQDQIRTKNPDLDEAGLLAETFKGMTINDNLKNDMAILSTRIMMNENFKERKDSEIISKCLSDHSEKNKYASQLFVGYELAYANLNDGCCMSVIDNDGEERLFEVKRIAADRGLHCHALIPLSPDKHGNRDIKILFRGTYDVHSLMMDLSPRAPGGEVMAANRIKLLRAVDRIVSDVKNKDPSGSVSLTIAGHSLGGSLAEAFTSEVHQAIYHQKTANQPLPEEADLLNKFKELGLYHGNESEQKKAARDVRKQMEENRISYKLELVQDVTKLRQEEVEQNVVYVDVNSKYRTLDSLGQVQSGALAETYDIDWETKDENNVLVWNEDSKEFNQQEFIESILVDVSKEKNLKHRMPQAGYSGLAQLAQVNTMGINSARLLSREARIADGFVVLNAKENSVKQELREFKAGGDIVSQVSKRSMGAGLVTVDPEHVSVSLLKKSKESNSLLRSIKAHMSYPFGTPKDNHLEFKFYNQEGKIQKELCKELSHTNLAMRLLMKLWRKAHKTPIVKDVIEKIVSEKNPSLLMTPKQNKDVNKNDRDIRTRFHTTRPGKKR